MTTTIEPRIQTIEGRDNSLDWLMVLRAVACLMVVISHAMIFIRHNSAPLLQIGGYDVSWMFCSSGQAGMWMFFTLSGYLMGKAFYAKRYVLNFPGLIAFYRNRILRICPLYFFSIIVLGLLVWPELFSPPGWATLFSLITFTFSGYSGDYVGANGNLWSIATEMQFYVIIPILALFLLRNMRTPWHIFIVAALVIASWFAHAHWFFMGRSGDAVEPYSYYRWYYFYTPLHACISFFCIGLLVNPFILTIKKTHTLAYRNRVTLQLLLLAVIYIGGSFFRESVNSNTAFSYAFVGEMVLPVIISLLTATFIWLSESDEYQVRRASLTMQNIQANGFRALEWIGVLTYGIYVWHGPVRNAMVKVLHLSDPLFQLWAGTAVTLAGATTLAWLTYITVEKSADRVKTFSVSSPTALNLKRVWNYVDSVMR